ncbi:MAG: GNAT family N-acetyltransferase [Promethearchaeota archaeon]
MPERVWSSMVSVNREKLDFYVRGCTMADLEAVIKINEVALPEHYPRFFYENLLTKYPKAFLVAIARNIDGEEFIIGYTMWRLERGVSEFGIKLVKKGHLVSLAVLEGFRRQGVATKLLQIGMNEMRKYGANEHVLEVRVSNEGAIKLYEDVLHYEKKKMLKEYYRDGEDAYFMAYRA